MSEQSAEIAHRHDGECVYVVTTPKGFTQLFDERQIRALVLLGLIEHERDGWLLENGKGEHIGPVHHFYDSPPTSPQATSCDGCTGCVGG